nr:MAG TPA: Vacuolar sorting protein 39 domain 1 [Caudoviricetes sp.]DAV24533.1 MAG TPA: Vacuolar sorting protein 39 domain 1 [Caudoviricetes sp.]
MINSSMHCLVFCYRKVLKRFVFCLKFVLYLCSQIYSLLMETIFDYAPTEWELNALRFDSFSFMLKFGIELKEELTPESYKKHITKEFAFYDLACLFEERGDMDKAEQYWQQLPKAYKEYGLGYDCNFTAV